MIRVTIKDLQNQEVAGAKFNNLPAAQAWVAEQTASQEACLWGKLASSEQVPVLEDGEPVRDDEGNLLFETVDHPQEFTVEFEDLGDAVKWQHLRQKRDMLLTECDWTQLADSPLSPESKEAWVLYRQDLRNLPQEFESPEEVVWPSKP